MEKHLQCVGQVFYGIAICDGNLHPVEKALLVEALGEYRLAILAKTENQHEDLPSALSILKDISSKGSSAWECFENFKNYFTTHTNEFNTELKKLIMSLASKIASSYAKQNKSEIVLLARTRLLLTSA